MNNELLFEILQSFGSIASLIIVIITYKQFKFYKKDFLLKNTPQVHPYFKVIKESPKKMDTMLYLFFQNDSQANANNLQITIDKNWLKILDGLVMNSYENFETLSERKDLSIMHNDEISYGICPIFYNQSFHKLSNIPVTITINYFNSKKNKILKTETHTLNLRSLAGSIFRKNETQITEYNKVNELSKINKQLEKLVNK
ncbi:MAG: hypothetical protein ACPKNR_13225 [Pleomorphochaeta sp.]